MSCRRFKTDDNQISSGIGDQCGRIGIGRPDGSMNSA